MCNISFNSNCLSVFATSMISTLFQSISWPKLLAWSLTEDCLFPVSPCLCSFNLVLKCLTVLPMYYIGSSELTFLIDQRRSWPIIDQDRSGIWPLMSGSVRNGQDRSGTVRIGQERSRTIRIGQERSVTVRIFKN